MVAPLVRTIQFLEDFGFFDVVLPFILAFTIVFAILDKTRILGSEDNKPKKNLNAMVAFVIAMFVVATPKVVNVFRVSLPQIVLVLVLVISIMMLIGSLYGSKEEFELTKIKKLAFLIGVIIIISIFLIFLSALEWLEPVVQYLIVSWDSTFVVSMIFLVIAVVAIIYIVGNKNEGGGRSNG